MDGLRIDAVEEHEQEVCGVCEGAGQITSSGSPSLMEEPRPREAHALSNLPT